MYTWEKAWNNEINDEYHIMNNIVKLDHSI